MDVLEYAGYLDGYWDLCVKYYLKMISPKYPRA